MALIKLYSLVVNFKELRLNFEKISKGTEVHKVQLVQVSHHSLRIFTKILIERPLNDIVTVAEFFHLSTSTSCGLQLNTL